MESIARQVTRRLAIGYNNEREDEQSGPGASFTSLTFCVHLNPRRFGVMSLPARRTVAVPLLLVLGLSGCTAAATPATPDESYAPVPDSATEPTPAVTPNAIEPDMTLRVRATATAANGAQLALDMQVHQASPWDYVGTQSLPDALVEDCGDTLTLELFAAEQWTFTRVNVTAIANAGSDAEWPADATVSVYPTAETAAIAGRGMLALDPGVATPCHADKSFSGAGRGAFALGSPGDAGILTAWSAFDFGFGIEGATLSDCTIEGTDLGAQFGGASGHWATTADDANCVAIAAG